MTTTNVPSQINSEELSSCQSTKELMSCREFYILLELFCNDIGKPKLQDDGFLNLYFNDEGYVDIWRIPNLMIDAFNQNLKFNKVLDCEKFRSAFNQFLTELFNFCLSECQPNLLVRSDPSFSKKHFINSETDNNFLTHSWTPLLALWKILKTTIWRG